MDKEAQCILAFFAGIGIFLVCSAWAINKLK